MVAKIVLELRQPGASEPNGLEIAIEVDQDDTAVSRSSHNTVV